MTSLHRIHCVFPHKRLDTNYLLMLIIILYANFWTHFTFLYKFIELLFRPLSFYRIEAKMPRRHICLYLDCIFCFGLFYPDHYSFCSIPDMDEVVCRQTKTSARELMLISRTTYLMLSHNAKGTCRFHSRAMLTLCWFRKLTNPCVCLTETSTVTESEVETEVDTDHESVTDK